MTRRLVVVVPGLGLTRYVGRLARQLRRRGADVQVLDLPGWGTQGPAVVRPRAGSAATTVVPPHVDAMGSAAAQWVSQHASGRAVTLLGHSTGAQAALTAGLLVQESLDDVVLVLAGPTFPPQQRTLPGLLARVPLAYRHDGPWQLDPREAARAGPRRLLTLVRSGQRDRPEERVAALRLPLVLTAGRHDAFAPRTWLEHLAASAVRARSVRVEVLGGSHNNPWTHAADLADLADLGATTPTP